MKRISYLGISIFTMLSFVSCNDSSTEKTKTETSMDVSAPVIKEEAISYKADTTTMNSFVAYDASSDKKRPVVLIIPEWWGLTDYTKNRARQLANMGYVAMAVDMYGNGAIADNPQLAGEMSGPFYTDPAFAKSRFDAALAKALALTVADTSQVAAIGYCFGGAMVLNMARLGENLDGVVSFHGGLIGTPANKDLLRADILVCHGEADKFVSNEEVAQFKKQMDSIGAKYTFRSYPGASHAFSNPAATEMGKKFSIPVEYNAAADTASWNDMKAFFGRIFK